MLAGLLLYIYMCSNTTYRIVLYIYRTCCHGLYSPVHPIGRHCQAGVCLECRQCQSLTRMHS